MTVSLKHKFTSAKSDGTDSTIVQPSNWNDEHAITLAAGKVLGRDTSGNGAVQELPLAFDPGGQAMVPPAGTTAQRPSSPVAGMIRYNTTFSKFEQYNGSSWGAIGGGAYIGDAAPSASQPGDLWWKSDEGQMYVYYNDGTSSQWVVGNAFTGSNAYLPLTGGTISGNLSVTGTLNSRVIGGTVANSLVALDGSAKLPAVDGSQLTSILGRLLRAPQILLSGSSYTTPVFCTALYVEAVGAGGGGSGGQSGSGGGGGGGVVKYFAVTPNTSYTYGVGAAGTAGAIGSGNGGNGGNTTFTVGGVTITAGGGVGGQVSAAGTGGTATGGDLNIPGLSGSKNGLTGTAGVNVLGFPGGNPGLAYFGSGGPLQAQGVGSPTGYGGGGGGAGTSSIAGTAGGPGIIRIWEFA